MQQPRSNYFFFLLLSAWFLFSSGAQAAENPEKVYEFLETVALGAEYGRQEPVASRWMRSPSLSLFGANTDETETVLQVVRELNELLQEGRIQIKPGKAHDEKAAIRVYFADRDDFSALARKLGFEYISGNAGYFYVWWSPGHEIYRAVVFIDKKLKGKNRLHFVREEITQAMGLPNDSSLFKSSIFYQKGRDNGKAIAYSELDQKIIRFYYHHVRPGYDSKKLRQVFEQHWKNF